LLGFAEGANDGEAIGAGKHAVEDDGGDVFGGTGFGGEEVGESGVAVRFMMGAVAFSLEIEEQTLGQVFFIFDYGDEGSGRAGHGMLFLPIRFVTFTVT
jgi:hypothetical protein